MICVSVGHIEYPELIQILQKYELIEIRLDLLNLDMNQYDEVLQFSDKIIVCYRNKSDKKTELVNSYIEKAIAKKVKYIDLECNLNHCDKYLINKVINSDTKLILSNHNFELTPSEIEIDKIIQSMEQFNPDIFKLCFTANSIDDITNCLNLYKKYINKKLITFNLGDLGSLSRVLALNCGAEFMYAAHSEESKTEQSQLTVNQLSTLYGFINK
jgi:3-dehydroquinate dehydratase type I